MKPDNWIALLCSAIGAIALLGNTWFKDYLQRRRVSPKSQHRSRFFFLGLISNILFPWANFVSIGISTYFISKAVHSPDPITKGLVLRISLDTSSIAFQLGLLTSTFLTLDLIKLIGRIIGILEYVTDSIEETKKLR